MYTAIFNGTKIPPTPVPIIDNLMESEITEDTTEEITKELTEEITTNRKELNDFLINLSLFIISGMAIVDGFVFFILTKRSRKKDRTIIEEIEIEVKESKKKGEEII